jgi:hypothetical protein
MGVICHQGRRAFGVEKDSLWNPPLQQKQVRRKDGTPSFQDNHATKKHLYYKLDASLTKRRIGVPMNLRRKAEESNPSPARIFTGINPLGATSSAPSVHIEYTFYSIHRQADFLEGIRNI